VGEEGHVAQARQLMSLADVDAVLERSGGRPVLIFKHSTTCPISAGAYREWQAFLAGPSAVRVDHAWVRVREERPVSLAIAERTGVAHESPQALLVKGGKVLWHASHHAITRRALEAVVARV
jgi:bacillithiol system protein YtxJ